MPHSVSADRRPRDRKSTRLNSSHTVIYTLSLHDALPICFSPNLARFGAWSGCAVGDDEVASHAALGECRPEATDGVAVLAGPEEPCAGRVRPRHADPTSRGGVRGEPGVGAPAQAAPA